MLARHGNFTCRAVRSPGSTNLEDHDTKVLYRPASPTRPTRDNRICVGRWTLRYIACTCDWVLLFGSYAHDHNWESSLSLIDCVFLICENCLFGLVLGRGFEQICMVNLIRINVKREVGGCTSGLKKWSQESKPASKPKMAPLERFLQHGLESIVKETYLLYYTFL